MKGQKRVKEVQKPRFYIEFAETMPIDFTSMFYLIICGKDSTYAYIENKTIFCLGLIVIVTAYSPLFYVGDAFCCGPELGNISDVLGVVVWQ